MTNVLRKKICTACLYFLIAFSIEAFLFMYLGWGFFPEYFWFDLALIMFFTVIIFAVRPTWLANTILCFLLAVQMVLAYTNMCIYTSLFDVFSINMLGLVHEATTVVQADMFPIWPLVFFAGLIAIITTCLILFRKIKVNKLQEKHENKWIRRMIVAAGLALSMFIYSIQAITLWKPEDERLKYLGDNYLYNTFSNSRSALKKFGSFAFYLEEIARIFTNPQPLYSLSQDEIDTYLSNEIYDPTESAFFDILRANGVKDNVIVIIAESFEWYGISPELTPMLYAMANGYDLGQVLNDFYDFDNQIDVFEGYSLPSRKDFTYSEEDGFTSNDINVNELWESYDALYGMMLENYYARAKTDYTETSVILGNYPYNESFTTRGLGFGGSNLYPEVSYSFSLPNMLKSSGYLSGEDSYYYHTYSENFYSRADLYGSFGFDNFMFLNQMTEQNDLMQKGGDLDRAPLDSQFMHLFLDDFIHLDENGNAPASTYLNFFMTVSTHGAYTYNSMLDFHYSFVDSVNWLGREQWENNQDYASVFGQARTFLAKCLDTEYMVAMLINGLIESGQLDNTLLLFMSDHNSYMNALDIQYKSLYYAESDEEYFTILNQVLAGRNITEGEYGVNSPERFAIPCFFWSKNLPRTNTQKFATTFDLLPTVLTLCGVDFNPQHYLGYSIFEEDYTSVIISHMGGMFNNLIFTENGLVQLNHEKVSNEVLAEFSLTCARQIERWIFITELYKKNLF